MRMREYRGHVRAGPPTVDPALLAFVKCHLTSFARWDVVRALADRGGEWIAPRQLALEVRRPPETVGAVLGELCREGILEAAGSASEPLYRLSEREPTGVVVGRMVARVTQSRELRRLIVANILGAAVTSQAGS
jgi:hypothetical protein